MFMSDTACADEVTLSGAEQKSRFEYDVGVTDWLLIRARWRQRLGNPCFDYFPVGFQAA